MSRRWVQVAVLVVLVLATWWLQQSDDEPSSGPSAQPSPTATATAGSTQSPAGDEDLGTDPDSGLPWVEEADLPAEALDTLALIDRGGPYPYDEDDGTFGNFEGILPDRPRGYYREYTVETPGLDHRGARRIVTGDGGERYWTDDHYQSFERIKR